MAVIDTFPLILEDKWRWQDGSEAIFTNWNPSLSGNYAGCVGMDNKGLWNIYPCDSLNDFICEQEPS